MTRTISHNDASQPGVPFYALIISNEEQTIPWKRDEYSDQDEDVEIQMVAERPCELGAWREAHTSAHFDYAGYRIHGRRRGRLVELFRAHGEQETPHLAEQYRDLGYQVSIKTFPANPLDEYHIKLSRLIVNFVIPSTGLHCSYGLLGARPENGMLYMVYTSRSTVAMAAGAHQRSGIASLLDGGLHIFGAIQENELMLWAKEHEMRPFLKRTDDKPAGMGYIIGQDSGVPRDYVAKLNRRKAAHEIKQAIDAQAKKLRDMAVAALASQDEQQPKAASERKRNAAAKKQRQKYQARQKAKKRAAKEAQAQEPDEEAQAQRPYDDRKEGQHSQADTQQSDSEGCATQAGDTVPRNFILPGGQKIEFKDIHDLALAFVSKHQDVAYKLTCQ